MGIFGQPSIHSFDKAEIAFDDQKGMLHLTAHGRFTSLNLFLPVNEAFGHPLDAFIAAVDAILLR